MLIHLRNDGTTSQTVTSMAVNGASHPGTTVEAGQNAIVVVPMNPPLQPGNIWSVSFDKVGYGGRTLPEYFPVMVWPHSNDCPIVGVPGSESNAGEALKLGINSVFDDKGACDKMDPGSSRKFN